jgi:hypothetical protein
VKKPYETCPQLCEGLYGDPLSANYHGYTEADLKRKALEREECDRYIAAVDKLKKDGWHRKVSSVEFDDMIDTEIEALKND